VEEKQSRVVELLVAAMPVRHLLTGKVVGNTVMALGQIVVVVAAGVVGAFLTGRGELLAQLVGAAGWFIVFFLLGFVMLACLWAAAGALASRVEDLNATTVVMQVLVIVPFFAAVFTLDPGPVQRLLSYVPFTAPLLMPARVVLGTVEPWEPFVAALVVLGTGVLFVALGARVYRNAVLHTSSRLRATQAWRGVGA
jgi:ABC-2 type transport system permease protein